MRHVCERRRLALNFRVRQAPRSNSNIPDNSGYVPDRTARIILWTERGAARHATPRCFPTAEQQGFQLLQKTSVQKALADFFSISTGTLNNWKKAHPEFLESIKAGKDLADAEVADRLYQRAMLSSRPKGSPSWSTRISSKKCPSFSVRKHRRNFPPISRTPMGDPAVATAFPSAKPA